jgi:hypothetical protein
MTPESDMSETFTTKLGTTSKAGERTRIWLEGKRLVAHGFTVGTRYQRVWYEAAHTLILYVCKEETFAELARADKGTVSGKGDKPIIDIVGTRVREVFGKGETVNVTYTKNRIVITAS